MAGASIFAGMWGESYDMKDFHSRLGLFLTYVPALGLILVRYGLIPSALSVANVSEPTIANYHILAIIHD